jgi:hypothetical protein
MTGGSAIGDRTLGPSGEARSGCLIVSRRACHRALPSVGQVDRYLQRHRSSNPAE